MPQSESRCEVARNLLENGAHLIDVRSEEEFIQNSLPGALNIPLNLLSKIPHLINKESDIIVYCGTGLRSKNAHEILSQHDFNNVHDLGSFKTLQYC